MAFTPGPLKDHLPDSLIQRSLDSIFISTHSSSFSAASTLSLRVPNELLSATLQALRPPFTGTNSLCNHYLNISDETGKLEVPLLKQAACSPSSSFPPMTWSLEKLLYHPWIHDLFTFTGVQGIEVSPLGFEDQMLWLPSFLSGPENTSALQTVF